MVVGEGSDWFIVDSKMLGASILSTGLVGYLSDSALEEDFGRLVWRQAMAAQGSAGVEAATVVTAMAARLDC